MYICINKQQQKLKKIKMTYQEFTLQALNTVNNKPSKNDMQFAYVLFCGFNMTVKEAIETSLNNI